MSIQRLGIFSVLIIVSLLSAAQLPAADSEVNGVFLENDQPAKLAFVSAHKATPVAGQERIALVFTEKDHSKDAQPELKALFGNYGSALVVGIHADGKVVTCDIAHEALKQKPISSPSSVKMSDFRNEAGQISGKVATDSRQEAFGQTWEVSLIFKVTAPK
jgi:hypothetical protein